MLTEKEKSKRYGRKQVKRPDNIEVVQGTSADIEILRITIKPHNPTNSVNLAQLMVVLVFIVFPLTNLRFSQGSLSEELPSLFLAIGFILIWAVIIFKLLHKTLIEFFNKVSISIDGETLRIKAGPIPQRGVIEAFEISRITQFFCVRHRQRQRRGLFYSYSLNVKTPDGSVCLIDNMGEKQALFAEQILEDTLGIIDVKTTGEYPERPKSASQIGHR